MKVLVTGATGLLGGCLVPALEAAGCDVITHGHHHDARVSFDLSQAEETEKFLMEINPDAIINLVGLTNVDLCENDRGLAYKLNALTAKNIAAYVNKRQQVVFIHISTDHLYDEIGENKESSIQLTNIYSFTKHIAELYVLPVDAVVLRTNFFGKSSILHRKSFSDWLVDNLTNQQKLNVFDDVFFSPLSMRTLSKNIVTVLKKPKPGIFNLGSRSGMSKADFALELARCFGLSVDLLQKTSSSKANFVAIRPKDMRMDVTLFEKSYQVALPGLTEEIQLLRSEYE